MKTPPVNLRSFFDLCILCHRRFHPEPGSIINLCPDCLSDLPWLRSCCSRCALPLQSPNQNTLLCAHCISHPPSFDRIQSPFHYRFPIDHLITQTKYQKQTCYISTLAELLWHHCDIPDSADALIPVPMHPYSLIRRGFNQADLLARQLSRLSGIPLASHLIRKTRTTHAQMGLNRQQRLRNQKGAFNCKRCPGLHLILIDDVMTTGATLETLSHSLKKAGARRVEAITCARTDQF
ncbi:ComF family protein [Neptuniibacter halophilus]|uniref:ComF family protein n=1 Tax=Neptuniibacter halophilus TaxID=651666 RepID=UPI002574765C|nr:ComF family protein [Neptuniibacter halophilus]